MIISDKTKMKIAQHLSRKATAPEVRQELIANSLPGDFEFEVSNKTDLFFQILDNAELSVNSGNKNIGYLYDILKVFISFGTTPEIIQLLKRDKIQLDKLGLDKKASSYKGFYESPAKEQSILSQQLYSLKMKDIQNVLDQAIDNLSDGKLESSGAMCRATLEGILIKIATKAGSGSTKINTYSQAIDIIKSNNIFSKEACAFIDKLLGFFSHAGSHFGVAEELLAKQKVLLTIWFTRLFIEKYNNMAK